jgi:hypothetical protein
MLISCSGNKRGVIIQRDDGRGTAVKENDGGRWSSDDVVL